MKRLISNCPICNGSLSIPVLKCNGCGLEMKNDFELSPFDRLSEKQYSFLISFLKNQGNLKAIQEQMNLSYPAVKRELAELLSSLGLEDGTEGGKAETADMSSWTINKNSIKASDLVKAKLVACGGRTTVHTLQGKPYSVWVEAEDSFACDKLITYTYDIFDVIVEHLVAQGGRARKGNGRGHLGGSGCEDDTIAAAILKNYWHSDTGFDPGFVMIAILEWAGIVHNRRGTVELTAEYRVLRSAQEEM